MKEIDILSIICLCILLLTGCSGDPSGPENLSGINMVLVEGGAFTMGNARDSQYADQLPVHRVSLGSFFLSKYEITWAQYRTIMGQGTDPAPADNLPVERVSWFDAVEFCNLLSGREGLTPCYLIDGKNISCDFSKKGYRLPTEAEWEYAARGGGFFGNHRFSGSDNINQVAWYYSNSNGVTHAVGRKLANELGLFDMSGNVWEWCWDWYGFYSTDSLIDPTGPETGIDRIFRGGNMITHENYIQVTFRGFHNPSLTGVGVGFRVARTY